MSSTAHGRDRIAEARERLKPLIDALVARAHADGALRDDVRGQDLALLQVMLGAVLDVTRDVRPDLWRRFLALCRRAAGAARRARDAAGTRARRRRARAGDARAGRAGRGGPCTASLKGSGPPGYEGGPEGRRDCIHQATPLEQGRPRLLRRLGDRCCDSRPHAT